MHFAHTPCSVCGKILERRLNWILENERYGYKTYCSKKCQSKGKTTKVQCVCANPRCKKEFSRELNDVSPHNYCSRSCAVAINNVLYPKRKKITTTRTPTPRISKYTKESIISEINHFFQENQRIPLKIEFSKEYWMIRKLFGTWNSAIRTAGFSPHVHRFAHRYKAKDQHMCDSLAEKIIDDWLFTRGIKHKIHVPYHYRNMTADFLIGTTLVEYLGLYGKLHRYDVLVEEKRKLWKRRKLDVIEIYPEDLFPQNQLSDVLSPLLIDGIVTSFTV